MPVKMDSPTNYSSGGRPTNRGAVRRINPIIFLTIGCVLLVLLIVASLIVFTFLPLFTSVKENQTKYQVQSAVLTLVYNLPDKLSTLNTNWTYIIDEFESDKISILQNLLENQLKTKKSTRKTSITVLDAYVIRQNSSSTNLLIASPVTLDDGTKQGIVITQPDNDTNSDSTTQLRISLMLRYAFECSQRCQNNLKEAIYEKTFYSLELPIDVFQTLFINELKTSTIKLLTRSTSTPCVINTRSSVLASSMIMAVNYEAESLLNTFISTKIQSCSVCSGEQNVGNIGFVNELIFQQILSQYGGSTIIVFYYTTDRIRSAEIIVNNRLPSINITFPNMSPKQSIASLPATVNLCQGFNSIRVYNPYDYTPDFDRIIVY